MQFGSSKDGSATNVAEAEDVDVIETVLGLQVGQVCLLIIFRVDTNFVYAISSVFFRDFFADSGDWLAEILS